MVIPPDFFTTERAESDREILKLYYSICDELNLIDNPKISDTFKRLSKVVGSPIFLRESVLLGRFINKKMNKEKESWKELFIEKTEYFNNKA